MSMHRRPLGRGRTMAAIGGGLMVVGCVLPWWQVGGTPGIPAESGNGLAGRRHPRLPRRDRHGGAGGAAIRRRRSAGRPRPLAVLRAAGGRRLGRPRVAGRRARACTARSSSGRRLEVFADGPGLWIAALGLVVLSRATYTMTREPVYR